MIHLKVIERQKELIGKLLPVSLRGYLLLLQLALSEEHTIESPPLGFIDLMKIILN